MVKQTSPIALGVATLISLGLLVSHFWTQSRPDSFEFESTEWRVPAEQCLDFDQAAKNIPVGFELPNDDELRKLSIYIKSRRGLHVRSRFRFMSEADTRFWSSHYISLPDRRFVVRLSDSKATSLVPELCAYTLVKRSAAIATTPKPDQDH